MDLDAMDPAELEQDLGKNRQLKTNFILMCVTLIFFLWMIQICKIAFWRLDERCHQDSGLLPWTYGEETSGEEQDWWRDYQRNGETSIQGIK